MIAKLVSFAIDMIHPEPEEAHCKPFPHYPAHIQRIPINQEFPMTEANVSPVIPEADVSMISAMFTRIADGLVQASALAKEVSELRSVVASLKSDIEYVRDQNKWLDEQLANVRRSRDETQRELDEVTTNYHKAEQERDTARRESDDWQGKFNHEASTHHDTKLALDEVTGQHDTAKAALVDTQSQLVAVSTEREQQAETIRVLREQLQKTEDELHETRNDRSDWRHLATEADDKLNALRKHMSDILGPTQPEPKQAEEVPAQPEPRDYPHAVASGY